MNKIWTLVACTLMAATLTFAQEEEESDYFYGEQSYEPAEQQEEEEQAEDSAEEQVAPAPVFKQEVSSNTQNNVAEASPASTDNETYADDTRRNKNDGPKFGFGAKGAFNYGRMFGFSEEDDDVDGNPQGFGFEVGVMLRFQMIPNLYFTPEFNIAYISTSHKYLEYDRTYKSLDLEIPLLIRGVVAEKFYITAGPQLVIGLNSEADIDPVINELVGISVQTEETVKQTGFTFGLAAGAGINIVEGLNIDFRFYMGLMELYPDVKTLDDIENFEEEDYSIVSMKGAKMMKFKLGLSYWFI